MTRRRQYGTGSITPTTIRGVWRIDVNLGTDPVTGRRRRYVRHYHGTRSEAETYVAQVRADRSRGLIRGTRQTFDQLLERWLRTAELAQSTRENYARVIRDYLSPHLGSVPVDRIDAAALDSLYGLLRSQGVGVARIRTVHAVASSALTKAAKWGWITTNPARYATPPADPRNEAAVPAPDVVARLMTEVDRADLSDLVLIRLAAATGARRGELVALRWGDIDLKAGTVTIRRALSTVKGGWVEKPPKNNRTRTVSIGPNMVGRLRELRRARGLLAGPDWFVFLARTDGENRPLRPDAAGTAFTRIRDRVPGCEQVHLHSLRHFVATEGLRNGVPVKIMQGILGHTRATTTLDIYGHHMPGQDREAADSLDALLG
jgi:integrase